MARTKVFDEKQALEAAMLLFWKLGYEATSIQELEQVMGVKRTSIYNAFGNKRALFQQSLMHYMDVVLMSRFIHALEQSSTAREAIEAVLKEVIKLHFNKNNPGGCMVVLSLSESNQHDSETKKLLDMALEKLKKAIVVRLEQGVVAGELAKDTPCATMATQITTLITGMIIMAKGSTPKKELERLVVYSNEMLFP